MAGSLSSCDHQEDCGEEMMEFNKDFERMIEDVENISGMVGSIIKHLYDVASVILRKNC